MFGSKNVIINAYSTFILKKNKIKTERLVVFFLNVCPLGVVKAYRFIIHQVKYASFYHKKRELPF